jgi:Protein of unknown function (DUF4236)
MAWRFQRRIRLFKGVSVNVSKGGTSLSVGGRGAHVTVGRRGIRRSVGLPGTGLSYSTNTPWPRGRSVAQPATEIEPWRRHLRTIVSCALAGWIFVITPSSNFDWPSVLAALFVGWLLGFLVTPVVRGILALIDGFREELK